MSFSGNAVFNPAGSRGPGVRGAATDPATGPRTAGAAPRPEQAPVRIATPPPRPGYVELKANVHRKLLNRLNLEALASADRARAETEIRTLLFELIAEENTPLSMSERESFF